MTTPATAPSTTANRNHRPIVTTLVIALAVLLGTMILAVALGPTRPEAPRAMGQLYGDAFFGFIALAVWATRSQTRWSRWGWLWRTVACVLASMVIMGTLASVGRAAP